jgi:acyl-CoA thioester hydrolase
VADGIGKLSAPFTLRITATPDDIDELGHVNNAVWVRWIQDVAVGHWSAIAPPEHVAAYIWVVTRHEIDYRGNVSAGETVTAETWVEDPPKGARFDRMMRFTGASGRVKVEARTTWALIDRATGRLLRVPKEVATNFLP